jgi:hypothetical protein
MTWQNSDNTSRAGDPYTATAQLEPDERSVDDVVYYTESTGWLWVAAGAAVVLVLAVIGTVVILRSGDDTSTNTRVVPSRSAPIVTPRVSTPPPPVATTTPPSPSPSPSPSPLPETVTTLTPSATTSTEAPPTTSETAAATFNYTVSGTRRPGDFVTVTYIDGTGAPRTDFNVALPWRKTVIPAGAMLLKSVTAVSLGSHLDCSITDADGQTIASQDFNTIATTCNS